MSFRLVDLKKSVSKTKNGYQVTPSRLEGRAHSYRIEFMLQQLETHLGRPRRSLDPGALLQFMGDSRLGRGLISVLSQWYRMRPGTFSEVLGNDASRLWVRKFSARGIESPVDLRAWLYEGANCGGGFLDPHESQAFWESRSRMLGIRQDELTQLVAIDHPDEAILVRTGPGPSASDVMAAYNARAHTTLLRSAQELNIHCRSLEPRLREVAASFCEPLGIEWSLEAGILCLRGKADALGCWTRQGRQVERAALEILALKELQFTELEGKVQVGERICRFHWKTEVLSLIGAGGGDLNSQPLVQAGELAALLRRERAASETHGWGIRQPSHLLAVDGGLFLPQLEVRFGDVRLYLRTCRSSQDDRAIAGSIAAFSGKTPVGIVRLSEEPGGSLQLFLPGEDSQFCRPSEILQHLQNRLSALQADWATPRRVSLKAA